MASYPAIVRRAARNSRKLCLAFAYECDALVFERYPEIIEVGCMAYGRLYFNEAMPTAAAGVGIIVQF